jgi:hypothetical protein
VFLKVLSQGDDFSLDFYFKDLSAQYRRFKLLGRNWDVCEPRRLKQKGIIKLFSVHYDGTGRVKHLFHSKGKEVSSSVSIKRAVYKIVISA